MDSTTSSRVALLVVALGSMYTCADSFLLSSGPLIAAGGTVTGACRLTPAASARVSSRHSQSTRMMAGALDETKGVTVDLAEYKGGAIVVKVPRMEVSDAQIEAALISTKKPYKLVPVRFVEEGGTKMGHTVIISWEAKVNSRPVPGAKKDSFELELKEGQSEPWNTFATKLAVGMGQMETKVFPATFPEDFETEGLRGKDALVQAVVKKIMRKEDKPPETRSDDELRGLLRAKWEENIQNRMDQSVDEAVKKALLASCDVNADKVLNAVSWAKFGEKSTLDFKWNCIKEKIANVEGIEAREVSAMLRAEADIEVVERP